MRALNRISSLAPRTNTNIEKGSQQANSRTQHTSEVTPQGCTQGSPGNHREQRHAVSQIRRALNAASGNRDDHPLPNRCPDGIGNSIGFLAAAEHLGQLLTAAPALFMTSTATAMLDFNQSMVAVDCLDDPSSGAMRPIHFYQRRSGAISSKGRSFAATASRALKIRERTVPIGQFMLSAISS